MKRNKKIVIPIGMMHGDIDALRWASLISDMSDTEEVHLVHCISNKSWLNESLEYPYQKMELEDQAMEYMMELTNEHWSGVCGATIDYEIGHHDNFLNFLLHEITDLDADLVILGREAIGSDTAIRLIRKSTCSVLMIPEDARPEISEVIIPTDFSDLSKYAYDVASAFARELELESVQSIHGFNIGNRPHKATIPIEKLNALAETHAMTEHAVFVSGLPDFGVKINRKEEFSNYIPALVQDHAKKKESSLIVLSCRGSNSMMGWLLGTIPENLLRESEVPVMAVKIKNTGSKLLNQLLGKAKSTEKDAILAT